MKKKIVMMLLAGALAASTMTGCGKKEESVKPETDVKVEQVKKDENIVVGIDVTADKGWEQTSTPTIVHLESTDGQTDLYHAVKPETGKQYGSEGSDDADSGRSGHIGAAVVYQERDSGSD